MLPWPERSPEHFPIEHAWNIVGRQIQRHPLPARTVADFTDPTQQ
ncbi:hypothetical protein AVEN_22142-1, partial [Araneus ventricosus]